MESGARPRVSSDSTSDTFEHSGAVALEGWVWKLGYKRRNWCRRYAYLDNLTIAYHTAPRRLAGTDVDTKRGEFWLDYTDRRSCTDVLEFSRVERVPSGRQALAPNAVSSLSRMIYGSSAEVPDDTIAVFNAACNRGVRTYYLAFESSSQQAIWEAALHCNRVLGKYRAGAREKFSAAVRVALQRRNVADADNKAASIVEQHFGVLPVGLASHLPLDARVHHAEWFQIHAAASQSDRLEELVRAFFAGKDVHVENSEGASTLLQASGYGNLAAIMFLLGHGAAINGRSSRTGNTALHTAAAAGHENAIVLLLEQGAQELPNHAGETPQSLCVSTAARAAFSQAKRPAPPTEASEATGHSAVSSL